MRSDEKTKLIMKEKWNKFSVKVEVREYAKRSLRGRRQGSPSQDLIISEMLKKSLRSAFGCFHRSELSCCSGAHLQAASVERLHAVAITTIKHHIKVRSQNRRFYQA